MLDLTKAVLPSAVLVDGVFFAVKTDFRFWLNFIHIVSDSQPHLLTEFDFLYDGKIPEDRQKGFEELQKFGTMKRPLPRPIGGGNGKPSVDFEQDAELIYSAFMEQYGIDLIDKNLRLHWWKFQALFNGLHNTKLNDVMGYRQYDENDKTDYKKSRIQMRNAWELERKLTADEQAALDKFNSIFK